MLAKDLASSVFQIPYVNFYTSAKRYILKGFVDV